MIEKGKNLQKLLFFYDENSLIDELILNHWFLSMPLQKPICLFGITGPLPWKATFGLRKCERFLGR